MANGATKQPQQSVAEQLRKEQEETQARLKEAAQKRLAEVHEQIGPLQKEEGDLKSFLGIEDERPDRRESSAPRQRRSRKGGTRAEQAVKVVGEKPGITASEIAKEVGIQPNYLYRVLSDLAKEGQVKKEGSGYHPVAA